MCKSLDKLFSNEGGDIKLLIYELSRAILHASVLSIKQPITDLCFELLSSIKHLIWVCMIFHFSLGKKELLCNVLLKI